MKAFEFNQRVIDEYAAFSRSFTKVRAKDLFAAINRHYDDGRYWPDPLLSLNPAYEHGPTSEELASSGILSPETATVFRYAGQPMRFHRHQGEAISKAKLGQSFVVTTGTGSGKSLCFFVPIIDRVIAARTASEPRRTRAIIVYPMNALANSQLGEFDKFVDQSGLPDDLRPTVARYTGQEADDERRAVAQNPPDILLTNFMMLELLLTRQDETDTKVIANCEGLEFIVLDELHTYRGRQGADVSILVRRLRDRCQGDKEPICIGTSATMASPDVAADPQKAVARVASRIFGAGIGADAVIAESLRRATDDCLSLTNVTPELSKVLGAPFPENMSRDVLARHPLAVWTELQLGLDEAKSRKRRDPVPWSAAVDQLAVDAKVSPDMAASGLSRFLALAALPEKDRGGVGDEAFMAFKLHRFVSGAGDVLTTLKPQPRSVHLEGQRNDPDDAEARLYPTRFCRNCGQEYHVAALQDDADGQIVLPRDIDETPQQPPRDGEQPGYLTPFEPAGDSFRFSGEADTCPEDWLEERQGVTLLKKSRKAQLPRSVMLRPDGRVSDGGKPFWFVPGRFAFCLACGDQPSPQSRERNKLGGLSSEGRSSATTTIVTSMLQAMNLPDSGVPVEKRKTLGFTDNRQDAALQAGHFNDSVFITLLRGAVMRAVLDAGTEGLSDDRFGLAVQKALRFIPENATNRAFWMANPEVKGENRNQAARTLAKVLEHRVWADMRRGWRFTYPNLFGVGLLRVEFAALDEMLSDDDAFVDAPPVISTASDATRREIAVSVLNTMLEGLAIATAALDPLETDPLKGRARSLLCAPWSMDPREDLRRSAALVLDTPSRKDQSKRDDMLILRAGPKSGLARKINRASLLGQKLAGADYDSLMRWLLHQLKDYGIVVATRTASDLTGWQIQPSVVRLLPGPALEDEGETQNEYFKGIYLDVANQLASGRSPLMGMESREHTAQVTAIQREWREWRFRQDDKDKERIEANKAEMVKDGEGTSFLPVLFCSPTMELGVDISALNAVYLRNVPPTPANYAQRAGRAGRSGQAAVITTYCAAQSPHDQYFFQRMDEMVAGSVRPPALDLANEELVRAHLHAIWLAETGQALSSNIPEVLDLTKPGLPIRDEIATQLSEPAVIVRAKPAMERVVTALLDHFDGARPDWLEDVREWVAQTAERAGAEFDGAFKRWRDLHASASEQLRSTQEKLRRPGIPGKERQRLDAQATAASQQIGILENGKAKNGSDFYTYRYLATEGFLPGYNFPRLPLYAFVPAGGSDSRAAFLQRARFLAISEFGPRSLIYHEGRAYRVHKAKLPPGAVSADGKSLATEKVFICPNCGAAHDQERERCHACDTPLAGCLAIQKTLRIDNVETLPAERITANDEERVRQGFEIQTVFTWPRRDGRIDISESALQLGGKRLAVLQYANSAEIMRLNLGLKRRAEKEIRGFPIDPLTGSWSKLPDEVNEADRDPEKVYPERIVPVVHDRKNSLLLRFSTPEAYEIDALTTVQHALLRGIEIVFQLEEGEVLGEPLPDKDNRRAILFYEATEGGAGVLGRIMREPDVLRRVISEALTLMHYYGVSEALDASDASKLSDDKAPCVAGCYRCLLSYYNQPDHERIDRRDSAALALLVELANASAETVTATAGEDPWTEAFLAQGLKKPDPKPWQVDEISVPYVWHEDLVAAMPGPIPQNVAQTAARRSYELIELPETPTAGVPKALVQLLKGDE